MEEKITFYTTHCPMCRGLEMKLKQSGLEYETCEDIEQMKAIGLTHAPALVVGTEVMDFTKAMKWLRERKAGAQ